MVTYTPPSPLIGPQEGKTRTTSHNATACSSTLLRQSMRQRRAEWSAASCSSPAGLHTLTHIMHDHAQRSRMCMCRSRCVGPRTRMRALRPCDPRLPMRSSSSCRSWSRPSSSAHHAAACRASSFVMHACGVAARGRPGCTSAPLVVSSACLGGGRLDPAGGSLPTGSVTARARTPSVGAVYSVPGREVML